VRVAEGGKLAPAHSDVLLVLKVLFNYHSVDPATDSAWLRACEQEDSGEVRADIVPLLLRFHADAAVIPDFLQFPAAGSTFTTFLLQPYYSGGDLQGLIKRRGGAGLARATVLLYLMQLLDAVRTLKRRGRAHRDIKSDNIFLSGDWDRTGTAPKDLALVKPKHTHLVG
jgi:serine/threonine protein kinase